MKSKYYVLDIDNYGQPSGSIKTVELTKREYETLKRNHCYIYENYIDAIMRSQN